MRKLFCRLAIIAAASFAIAVYAHADDQITEETFIKFSEAAGFEKLYDQMINIIVSNFQNGMIQGFENSIRGKEIPGDLMQKINPMVRQSAQNIKISLENFFKNEIQFKDLVETVYLPIYRKHFTEQEIIELIQFYNSPVGKKLSALSPAIMQESALSFNQSYGPKVEKIGAEIVNNEVKSLIEKVRTLKDNS